MSAADAAAAAAAMIRELSHAIQKGGVRLRGVGRQAGSRFLRRHATHLGVFT